MTRLRILIALTYYRPHVSGLTIYAERLARGLVRHGHQVTVLTARYHPRLPAREISDGVDVVRAPVALKVSKGVIMPLFLLYADRLLRRHDVLNVHMPQFEAAPLMLVARRQRRPVVLTYHCDLQLPSGWFNRIVEASLGPLNHSAARLADRIVATTDDYARHSPLLQRHSQKLSAILPVIDIAAPDAAALQGFVRRWNLEGRQVIGFAARFAAEKGVEYLLRALPQVLDQVPQAHIVFTGAYKDTVGEDAYWRRLVPFLERYRERLTFLDLLPDDQMPLFYGACSVLAVTSLNATEAFGMVQVEAVLCGTPVVATDIPGVREVVRRTGMGELVPPHDEQALAAALVRVMRDRQSFVKPHAEIAAAFDAERSIRQYEELFGSLAPGGESRDFIR